jgi:outer membrane protein
MKKKIFIIGLILVQFAFTQQRPQTLSLTDCVNQALGRNPSLKISEAKVESADAREKEANAALLPQLKLSGNAAELSNVPEYKLALPPPLNISKTLFPNITENYSMKLSLQQPLFTGFKLSKNKEMAALNSQAAREDLTKEQSDLVVNVTVAYWNLYRMMETEKVISQTETQLNEHLKNVQNFYAQGLATDVDVMKVQVQQSEVRVKHVQARNNIRLAAMTMNSLIGSPLTTDIVTGDNPETIIVDVDTLIRSDLSALTMRALEKRLEIKSMRLRREMNNAGVAAAKGGWYPQIYIGADYNYANPNSRYFPMSAKWNDSWNVGITFQWTVWDWLTTQNQTLQAEAALKQSDAGLSQLYDAVKLDVAQQFFLAQTAEEEMSVTNSGVQQVQESYRMTLEKFKSGLASNSDLLDSETALLQAKLSHMQALVDYVVTIAKLKRAIGEIQ